MTVQAPHSPTEQPSLVPVNLEIFTEKIDQADIVFHIAGNADAIHF